MRGAHLCDHMLGGGDHIVVMNASVENPQVRQKRCWGAFLASCEHLLVRGAQLRDHLVDDDDHLVIITRRAKTSPGSIPSYLWTQIDEWSRPVRPHTGQ